MVRWRRSVRRWVSKLRVVKWQSWSRDGSRELAWIARTRRARTSWVQQLELKFFQPLRRPAKDDQWQRDGFTMLMSVPWDTGGPTGESMAESRRKHVTESHIQDEAPGGPVHLEASLRVTTKCKRRFELPMNPNVIGGNPAVRRVVKGSRSAGDEAS